MGEGAIAFARALGFEDFYAPTQRAKDIHVKILKALMEGTDYDFQKEWRDFDFQHAWNFETRWDDVVKQYGSSTIGAVAMDEAGNFAATVSTGGSSPMLRGRVGGTGDVFNLGEATVTRCAVRVGDRLGVGYVLGRDRRHAELVALLDAMLQDAERRPALLRTIIEPLERGQAQEREARSRAVAASRVEFFTMVREAA